MGAKRSFCSPNGGGSLFVCSLHSERGSISSGFPSPFPAPSWQIFSQIGQNRAKMNFFLLALVFSRDFRRPKRAKTKICFTFGAFVVLLSSSFVVAVVVSTGCRWAGPFEAQDLPECRRLSSGRVFPAFSPLSRFVLVLLLANMALFRVYWLSGGVSLVPCVFVSLWCFAWLVGLLYAWIVRRFKGLLRVSPLVFFSCPLVLLSSCSPAWLPALPASLLFVLLSWLCGLAFGVGWVVVSFSLSDYTQKRKGAKCCYLRPLLFCCGCLDSCIVIKEFRCCCFGFFQFIRLIMPTNTASVWRFARFHFDFLRHYVDITYNPSAFLK